MSLIGQQVFVAPGQVFDGIGSGGGGGGGNTLTLSTLTFGIGLGANNNNIQYQTNQLVLSGVGDSNAFNIGYGGTNQEVGNQYSVQMVFDNGAGGDITFGDINGNSSALTAINFQSSGLLSGNISTFIYGTTQILPSGALNGAGSELLVSSILCSSINGAAPGGGVAPGANLTGLSTISVSSMTVTNGLLVTDGIAMSNTTLGFDTQGQAIQYFNAGDSNLYIRDVSSQSVRIGTASNASVLTISEGGLAVENITGVSTINGSQPTTKASYQVSTLTAGVGYIPQNNVAWPLSGDIPVTPGHIYRISGNLALSNAGGSGATSITVSGGGAGFPQFLHSYPNSLANPSNNGLAGGIAGIVTPNASPLQIVGYNTDATQSTAVEFYYLNWLVEDLGTNL